MGLLSRRANEMHQPPAGTYPAADGGMTGPGPNNYEHGNVLNNTDPNAQPGMMQTGHGPHNRNHGGGLFNRHKEQPVTSDNAMGPNTHTGPAPMLNANTTSNTSGSPRTSRDSANSHTGTQHTMIEAGKLQRKGKMERTMGTLLCNSNMKRKSDAHLAQADHLKMQASELGEAERLEAEAGMRRQRAVGLGADPAQATGQTGYAQRTGTAM